MFTTEEFNAAVRELCIAVKAGCTDWSGYGRIKEERNGDLVILNYTQQAMFANEWTVYECVCRGLILNSRTGSVVARAFDKFFNWGQGERKTDATIIGVTEKMDGSLGVSYRDADGELCVSTRGSFVSDQAEFATKFARKLPIAFHDDGWTLLFEIIYPANRIVVDYGDFRGLVLLAIRNTESGAYVPRRTLEEVAAEIKCPVVASHAIKSVDDLLSLTASLDASREGFVAEFSDGSRFKFKGEEYTRLAKAIQGLSFKNVLAAVQSCTFNEMLDVIPDEFCDEAREWERYITDEVTLRVTEVIRAFEAAPKSSRKEFAIWVNGCHQSLRPHLFAMLDGKNARTSVMSRIDRDIEAPVASGVCV